MISEIFRGEYPLPVRFKKTLYSEYWLPSTELAQDPTLWVMVERRVHEESMSFPEIQLLFDYYYWATARILSVVDKVSAEQCTSAPER